MGLTVSLNRSWRQRSGPCLQGYEGDDGLAAAVKDADVIIIPAGVPRKPGMTRDDLFKVGLHLRVQPSYILGTQELRAAKPICSFVLAGQRWHRQEAY
jgi:hypothetical protein